MIFFFFFLVKAQVDEVKGIMVNNVDKMLNNMERADDLEQKTCARDVPTLRATDAARTQLT